MRGWSGCREDINAGSLVSVGVWKRPARLLHSFGVDDLVVTALTPHRVCLSSQMLAKSNLPLPKERRICSVQINGAASADSRCRDIRAITFHPQCTKFVRDSLDIT